VIGEVKGERADGSILVDISPFLTRDDMNIASG
jgi:hypothetical protein